MKYSCIQSKKFLTKYNWELNNRISSSRNKICHLRPFLNFNEREKGNVYAVIGPKFCDGSFRPRNLINISVHVLYFICSYLI